MTTLHRFMLGSLLAVVSVSAAGAAGEQEEFRPPFWPAWYHPEKPKVPVTPSRLDHVEFRGVLSVAGETFVTLVDTTSSRALTIPLDQTVEGITVSDFRVESGTVRARNEDGRFRDLALHEARIVALAPPPLRPDIHIHRVRPRERDMDRVAQEIQRRREMRRQLLEAGKSPNVSPNPPPDQIDP